MCYLHAFALIQYVLSFSMPHYYVVIDFECTCWENQGPERLSKFPHEIIEFPAVFLNSKTLEIDYEFHAYVKPTENIVLSPFCTELTGIEQYSVTEADDLASVLFSFEQFLCDNGISDFVPCTDGPWDFQKFLYSETERKGMQFPQWARKWVDIRRRFEMAYSLEHWIGVGEMLKHLDLEFEGRPHSGIDDARNIARIVAAVHQKEIGTKGGKLRPNRFIKKNVIK